MPDLSRPTPEALAALERIGAHLARRYVGYGADYEDLRQEVLIGLYQARAKFNPSLGFSFHTLANRYMVGAALHALRAARRQRRKFPLSAVVDADEWAQECYPEPERACVERENLRHLLAGLSERERQVVLAGLHGESQESIGARLGLHQMSVSRIRGRALRKLRVVAAG